MIPNGLAHLEFLGPEPRGAPGQAAVFYNDDRVIGGGVIAPNRGATQITSLRDCWITKDAPMVLTTDHGVSISLKRSRLNCSTSSKSHDIWNSH